MVEIYPILYVIASAIATVTIDHLVTNIPSDLVLLFVVSIAILYFHLVNFKNIKTIYRTILNEPILTLTVNVFLAIVWWATYLGIYYLGASIYNIFYFSITAIFASISVFNHKKLLQIALLFATLFIAALLMHLSIKGILSSIAGGCAGFAYRKYSFALSQKTSLTSSQILSIRCWILWVALLLVSPLASTPDYINFHAFLLILLVAFLSFILQIWLNQQGILKAGVRKSTLILSWTPTATLICQFIVQQKFYMSWFILAVVCQIILFVIKSGAPEEKARKMQTRDMKMNVRVVES